MRLTDYSSTTLAAEVPDAIPPGLLATALPAGMAVHKCRARARSPDRAAPRPRRVRLMGADESEPGNVNAAPNVAFRFRTRLWARLTSPISIHVLDLPVAAHPLGLALDTLRSGRPARSGASVNGIAAVGIGSHNP